METAVFASSADAQQRLNELGLNEQVLLDAARRGFLAWASCTENHPPLFRGNTAWANAICALREGLTPHGWRAVDEMGLPLTVNASNTIAITVATGDENTAHPEKDPTTRSSKGPRTSDLIAVNRCQAQLFDTDRYLPQLLRQPRDRTGMILLFHRDMENQELRCELSTPSSMSVDGRVDGWIERIILSSTPFDGDAWSAEVGGGPDGSDIDIEIMKRA